MSLTGLRRVHEFDLCLFVIYLICLWTFNLPIHELSEDYHVGYTEHLTIFWLGIASIFINVIPKFLLKGGANRHLNDQTEKKFLTRNYVRLLFHILSGAFGFIFAGLTLWNHALGVQKYSLSTIKALVIFGELVHEFTIIVMIRNSDGIQITRTNNAFFAIVKAYYCMKLFYTTNLDDAAPYISGIFIYLSGFMATRIWCFILAMGQIMMGYSSKVLAENWYSTGMFVSHVWIINRTGAMPLANALFPFLAYHFRHELWTKKNGYRQRTFLVGLIPLAIYFQKMYNPQDAFLQDSRLHALIHILLGVYTTFGCGKYFKRQPIAGLDYKKTVKKSKKTVKKSEKTEETKTEESAKPSETEESAKSPTESEMAKEVLEMMADMSDTLSSCMRNEAAGWGRLSYYHSWTTLKKASMRSIRAMTDAVPLPSITADDVSVKTPHDVWPRPGTPRPAVAPTQVKRFLKRERLPSVRFADTA